MAKPITSLSDFAARGAAAQRALDKVSTARRFRAILVCEPCGGTIVMSGNWTTGDRSMAAYFLGRAPAGMSGPVFKHLRAGGRHELTVSYEDEPE